MRRGVLALLVVGATGCAGVMKPDPYAPATGDIAAGASGVPDVRCAGTPATGPARGFKKLRHKIMMRFAHPDHRGIDLIATTTGEQIIAGKIGYGTLDKALAGEDVELFACVVASWERIGVARTDGDGRFAVSLRNSARLPAGLRDLYASVVADRSGMRFLAYVAPAGTRVIVSDVDGTLTSSEASFVAGALIGTSVGVHPGAPESLQAAVKAGYQVVYLTARGDRFTDDTRYWLGTHGFPRGPMRLAPSLITMPGKATAAYKERMLRSLAGFQISAGVGNRNSDIAAYTAAGVPANRIYIKLPEYRGEVGKALGAGAAVGFGAYMPLPL